jgi:hypothetical protein
VLRNASTCFFRGAQYDPPSGSQAGLLPWAVVRHTGVARIDYVFKGSEMIARIGVQ